MTRYRDNLKAGEYDRLAKADAAGEDFVQFGATGRGPEDPDAPAQTPDDDESGGGQATEVAAEYDALGVVELRERASVAGIEGRSAMDKAELVAALEAHDAEQANG